MINNGMDKWIDIRRIYVKEWHGEMDRHKKTYIDG